MRRLLRRSRAIPIPQRCSRRRPSYDRPERQPDAGARRASSPRSRRRSPPSTRGSAMARSTRCATCSVAARHERASRCSGAARRSRSSRASSFDIGRGEVLGIVGGSGSGKIDAGARAGAASRAAGRDDPVRRRPTSPTCRRPRCRPLRRRFQMIFQDPMSSLNPRRTGRRHHRAAPLRLHGVRDPAARAAEALDRWWACPRAFAARYPHELSGGQRQRVGIARAIALRARLHPGRRDRLGPRRVLPGAGAEPARSGWCATSA